MDDAGIDEEEKPYYAGRLREWGLKSYYEGSSSALAKLAGFFDRAGWVEEADTMWEMFTESVDWWIDENRGLIWYDSKNDCWRDLQGRYAPDPYRYLWEWLME